MKKILFSALLFLLIIPIEAYALEKVDDTYNLETKYYKTTTFLISTMYNSHKPLSYTEEITEAEYNNINPTNINDIASIETTYKKMTTSIEKSNLNYKYKVVVNWKNMPSARSYDIIAIGFPASVKNSFSPTFENKYCTSSTKCYTSSTTYYSYIGNNGVGVVFKQPTGSLYSLTETLSVLMDKNTSSTIIAQYAYGDYAHAVKSISLDDAKSFKVDTSGIVHHNGTSSLYDAISAARATWTGTW